MVQRISEQSPSSAAYIAAIAECFLTAATTITKIAIEAIRDLSQLRQPSIPPPPYEERKDPPPCLRNRRVYRAEHPLLLAVRKGDSILMKTLLKEERFLTSPQIGEAVVIATMRKDCKCLALLLEGHVQVPFGDIQKAKDAGSDPTCLSLLNQYESELLS